ncbi:hypothetical protein D3C87_1754640 [compost metagenome]
MEQHDHRQEYRGPQGAKGEHGTPPDTVSRQARQDFAEDHRGVGADHVAGHGLEVHAQFAFQVRRHPVVHTVVTELQKAGSQGPEDKHPAGLRITEDQLVHALALCGD